MSTDIKTCPECGHRLAKSTIIPIHTEGEARWACTNWPTCEYVEPEDPRELMPV